MERPQADLSYVVEKIPIGPAFPTGQLHDISSGMRTFRPVIDGEHLEIDYDYCKGCGVCNRACKLGAITMVKETEV